MLINPDLVDEVEPLVVGGGQEYGLRSGTTPVGLCVAMATAIEIATSDQEEENARLTRLREKFIEAFRHRPDFFLNGSMQSRLPHNFNGGFEGIEALTLMRQMPEINFSAGSACTTGAQKAHVLNAVGLALERQRATFRLGLSWSTTEDDVDYAITRSQEVIHRLS